MHLKQEAPATDAGPVVDTFAPLAPLIAGQVGCLKGDKGAKLIQDDCVQDVGRLCLPKDIDTKTGEMGPPTAYRLGTTLVANPSGVTCAYKW